MQNSNEPLYPPTPQRVVDAMLRLASVGPEDYLIDLGSGDGRIVITAAKKYGARGFGVDLNPERIRESTENARQARVQDRVTFLEQDIFRTDLSQFTVVTMFPFLRVIQRLRLRDLKPGTRIVSRSYTVNDWHQDGSILVPATVDTLFDQTVYLWIVPNYDRSARFGEVLQNLTSCLWVNPLWILPQTAPQRGWCEPIILPEQTATSQLN